MKKRALLPWLHPAMFVSAGLVASADNFRPAYLQLAEHRGDVYDIRWTTPAQSEVLVMPVKPRVSGGLANHPFVRFVLRQRRRRDARSNHECQEVLKAGRSSSTALPKPATKSWSVSYD